MVGCHPREGDTYTNDMGGEVAVSATGTCAEMQEWDTGIKRSLAEKFGETYDQSGPSMSDATDCVAFWDKSDPGTIRHDFMMRETFLALYRLR